VMAWNSCASSIPLIEMAEEAKPSSYFLTSLPNQFLMIDPSLN
jgi:hypothetical protein